MDAGSSTSAHLLGSAGWPYSCLGDVSRQITQGHRGDPIQSRQAYVANRIATTFLIYRLEDPLNQTTFNARISLRPKQYDERWLTRLAWGH